MRRRSTLPAAFAVVLLLVGQLVAFAHESETRHVTCVEHGEQLDAVELADTSSSETSEHARLIGVEAGGDHEDCALASLLRESSVTPGTWIPPLLADVETSPGRIPPVDHAVTRSLYRIAPKTSPPVLS